MARHRPRAPKHMVSHEKVCEMVSHEKVCEDSLYLQKERSKLVDREKRLKET
jgi:hypothetical protein